jgi:hypothetical protein
MRGGDAAPGGGHRDASGLSFSFDVQVAGQAPQAVLDRNQSLAVLALPGKQSIAQQALGGAAGGTHLAPALYRPVLRFVEGARRALAAAEDAADPTLTLNGDEPARRGAPDRALLDYLEAFISDSFLPDVYVDFRGRATDMLAAPDAFRARARARAAYAPDVAGGRPVVPAAREMEAMIAELLRWAVQMPPFAHEITGARPPRLAQEQCLTGQLPAALAAWSRPHAHCARAFPAPHATSVLQWQGVSSPITGAPPAATRTAGSVRGGSSAGAA